MYILKPGSKNSIITNTKEKKNIESISCNCKKKNETDS